jgi:protein-L-isoaspartate(D-aspartate) O-methyltransferase
LIIAGSNDGLVDLVAMAAPGYVGGRPRSTRVLDAMRAVDRAAFLPPQDRWAAYGDTALGIGCGQTCSQPSMVALMLDLLELRAGDRLLEVGSGSGYAAAIASILVAPGGFVFAVDRLPELLVSGRINCSAGRSGGAAPGERIEFILADGSAGFPARAPYDRILVSAGARPGFREAPLLAELAPGGILVYPEERGRLFRLERRGSGWARESWSGVAFVPLLGANGG